MRLLGLTGAARSGKSTVAHYLVDTYNYVELSFATPIKEAIKTIFDVTDVQLDYRKEERVLPFDKTLRYLLQTLGTEWGRNMVDEDIWVKLLARDVKFWRSQPAKRGIVISDVRFENEADWIRRNGGTVVHIRRELQKKVRDHTSEWGVTTLEEDRFIHNTSDILHLHQEVDRLRML